MNIVVFEKKTGSITKTMEVFGPNDIAINVDEYEDWIEGIADHNIHMVVDREVVSKPAQDVEAYQINTAWKQLRKSRNSKLSNSDWTQVPDAPVDQQAWAEYRQALRDLPANTEDPRTPQWPTRPE